MFVFAHIPELKWLDVQKNRIVRFEATAPVTYNSFIRLAIESNRITSFDTRNLTLPALKSIYMDDNALTEIPTHWGWHPNLYYLGFDRNNLKQVDMSVFGQFPNLTGIFINENKIESIRTSFPVTLPLVDTIMFQNNQIVSVNFTGCNLPNLYYISLMNNQLTAVPPLFQRFPNTLMSVERNPIKCASMMSFKKKINESRLYVTTGRTQSECFTTSSIALDQENRGCCVA
uniref:Leucine rich immune protein (Coil-less) n=1 Tax=Anopheles funestus TaxID=62324 RepID=A0A182RSM6_ANOFN